MALIRRFDEIGRGDVDIAGGKGANLGELTRGGFPVPPGFVLTTDAYRRFVTDAGIGDEILVLAAEEGASERIRALFAASAVPADMAGEITVMAQMLGPAVAVRSSATAEDLEGASFAGQQDTYLNVRGPEALLVAVRDCWASLWTERALAYRARRRIPPASVALAVVVQRMVEAEVAGVMFTANPANGRRDEIVISAAWGLGESVVSGSVTTDDLVVAQGRVRARATADKAVMTVYAGAGTREQPVPADRRTLDALDDAAAVELAGIGARIEKHFGAPQDVEWTLSGGAFAVVQARPITALPEPEAALPTDWTVPSGAYYFRASIVEQLPDPLSPLFADLVDGSVTRSLQSLLREFAGEGILHDGDIGLPTVNGYAYYRYAYAGLWRMTVRTPVAMRKLFTGATHGAQTRWREYSHPRYLGVVESWAARDLDGLTDVELMDGVVELLDAGTEYYTSVQTIIPIAASSEVLFTQFYDRLVRRAGDPPAPTFLLGFDSAPIRAEKSLYDLAAWVRLDPALTAELLATPSDQALERTGPGWDGWHARFAAHLATYGHSVYNLDFRNALPADDPGPLVDTLRFYLDGAAADPHERQRRSAEARDRHSAAVAARLDPARRAVFTRLLRWAQSAAPVREDALADVGLAWPRMRQMLAELGRRRVADGTIGVAEDVFWLRRDEALGGNPPGVNVLADRKARWRGQRRATPPQMLPQGTVFDRFEALFPAGSADQVGDVLRGTGASAGQVTATARVLSGPADFGRMRPGDVLVASITTPAWTTLFALASGVVTDVGGPLSHSSVVAREYGIPAVLGTNVATRRIADGQRVRVDGDAGTVTLLQDGEETAVPDEAAEPVTGRPSGRRLAALGVAGGLAVGVWRTLVRRR
jgi:rifampicin phosphotransferase